MQATITYLLTEQAQRAQMAATGQPVARKQTSVEDIPVSWLDSPHLIKVDTEGIVTVDLTQTIQIGRDGRIGGYGWAAVYPTFDTMPTSGLDALERLAKFVAEKQMQVIADVEAAATEVRKREDREKAEKDEALRKAAALLPLVDAWLADPRAQAVSIEADAIGLMGPHGIVAIDSSAFPISDLWVWVALAKQRRELPKSDFIVAWVAEHGDDTLAAQFADGLACRKSIISMIADAAFAAAGVPEQHPDSVVCDNRDCPCSDNAVDCLPTEVYARWREIKTGLPEGATVEFRKVRDCLRDEEDGSYPGIEDGDDSATDPYYVADLKMPHGPFTFERRVKLG